MRFSIHNRRALVAGILLITIGLALPIAFIKLEWSMKDLSLTNSLVCNNNNNNNRPRTLRSQVTKAGTRYTAFVYKSCAETFSFDYSWFTSDAYDIVCDASDKSPLCTVNLDYSKGYELLGEKSLSLWRLVHSSPDAEEIIVKLDDDTLIQKHVMEEFVDNFAKNDKCVLSGIMKYWSPEFYWPLGRLYMFKRRALPPTGHLRWSNASFFNLYEDAQIGYLLGTEKRDMVCDVDEDRFFHTGFEDKRVEIKFKYFSATCPTAS